ncbi:hypothetical protein [Chondromyces apiculatus]|uniref:PLAT domain-containing protein n=1 Tax=Chondromyces apiculatus DSM 436 TaxID=1192034 RepID=A0A017SYM0_9BACT|nr:hypothetical protein [Chondromyces apiculatus]EYF01720.1 Hypothetical protein CAP_7855 [Chondromyces apiculatus DSM 436]
MIRQILTATIPLALTLTTLASTSDASNYPPSYDYCGRVDTALTGPFEIIRDHVDYGDHMKLTVTYDGYLRDTFADEDINIYIRLNGHDAFIGANAGVNDDAYIFLDSGPRACFWCSPGGYNQNAACDEVEYPLYSSGMWLCSGPSPTEEHLFYWAFNEQGRLNAWDIEVAAEANGNWDSNYGSNYHARLEAVSCTGY